MTAQFQTTSPRFAAEFYQDVPPKRLMAWLFDLLFTAILVAPLALVLLVSSVVLIFPIFLIPLVWAVTAFLYRWNTIANRSATWGMRLMAIELRDADGQPLSRGLAFMHTLGIMASFAFPLAQALSVALMALHDKGQGLTDLVLGTQMVNKGR